MNRIAIAASLLLLGACGSEQSGTVETPEASATQGDDAATFTAKTEDGEATITVGSQQVALPDGFTLYPGATVVTSSTVTQEQGSGVRVVMSTPASPLQVIDFYRKQAAAAGIVKFSEATQDDQLNIVGESDDGTKFTLVTSGGEGATTATLLVTKGF